MYLINKCIHVIKLIYSKPKYLPPAVLTQQATSGAGFGVSIKRTAPDVQKNFSKGCSAQSLTKPDTDHAAEEADGAGTQKGNVPAPSAFKCTVYIRTCQGLEAFRKFFLQGSYFD